MSALRDYQRFAVDRTWSFLSKNPGNPICVLPTGAGKSFYIATLCKEAVTNWNGRVLAIAHVKEILQQNYDHLLKVDPTLDVGIYSAGLHSRDCHNKIIVAGIQSIYRRINELGKFDLIIVDEAHRIRTEDDGMYVELIQAAKTINPDLRIIGASATPYRTSTGMIVGKDQLFSDICFEVSVRELIAKGYLCPLICREGTEKLDFGNISLKHGEFHAGEAEALMMDHVGMAISDILYRAQNRKSILIFASGIEHGIQLAAAIRFQTDEEVGEVYGETDDDDRSGFIKRFREGSLRWLVNCNVLTLGFDAPNVDCVAMVRATMSPGLYYQCLGRGFRIHPSKKDCLILDFGGNIRRHGPVDVLAPDGKKEPSKNGDAPVKDCPQCETIIHAAFRSCPHCGYEFPLREPKHDGQSADGQVISSAPVELQVDRVDYCRHVGKQSGKPSMRVDYSSGFTTVSEYICIEHEGYARERARAWWMKRSSLPVPSTIEEGLSGADSLKKPFSIMVRFSGKYPEIVSAKFEEREETSHAGTFVP